MKALLKALAEFNKNCPPIGKSANNPFYKSKYATLDAIQHHIKPHLEANGLVVIQANRIIDGMPVVETDIYHVESGECKSSVFPVVVTKQTAQDYGSAVSYAKRYSLSGILNLIIEDEDDDGNRASGNDTKSAPTPVAEKPWLNEKDPNWTVILDKVASGTPIATIRNHFKISKAIEAKLEAVITK